jgi:dTDP-4-amino-4,6-dideoxygalactose transaminase
MCRQDDMTAPWKLIPRYHPQFSPLDIFCSLVSKRSNILPPSQELYFLSDNDNTFWLNGATTALSIMLKALDLPAGSGIGVPVYTCVAVFEAIASAGLRCVFIDIDPETFGFDIKSLKSRREQFAAVIMVHTFGFAGDIKAIKEVVGDMPIIEDCSHALYCFRNNQHVGLQGIAGVFSFNINKPLSAGGGGLLIVNNPAYIPSVKKILEHVSNECIFTQIKNAVKLLVKSSVFRAPWYGLLAKMGFIDLYREGLRHIEVHTKLMTRWNRMLMIRVLNRSRNAWDRRKAIGHELAAMVCNKQQGHVFAAENTSWNGYLLPLLLRDSVQRKTSLNYFHQHNVDAFVLWSECFDVAGSFGYRRGECPHFEYAFDRILMLPCYAELTSEQLARLKASVTEWPGITQIKQNTKG